VLRGGSENPPSPPLRKGGESWRRVLDRAEGIGYKSPLSGKWQGWPGGAENKPSRGVDREVELGYKNKCRSGGQG
jgi:hypothetical protein